MTRLRPLLVALLLAAACAGYLALEGRVSTDLADFLPAGGADDGLLLEQLRDGRAARVLLLAVEGGDALARRRLSQAVLDLLLRQPQIARAYNGSPEPDGETLELLFRYRYLLSRQSLEEANLRPQLLQRLAELRSPVAPLDKRLLPADPTAAFSDVLARLRPAHSPRQRDGVWVSPDGNRALLVAELRPQGLDVAAQAALVAAIERGFAQLPQSGNARLLISGPARFAAEASERIRFETQWLSILASALLTLFLLVIYRSPRLVLLSALPLGGGVLAATAVTHLLFDGIHAITLAFGVTILGVAIDYPLHLFSHLRGRSPAEALRRVWPTLRLGVATTLAGYAALAFTEFPGLAQLGVFAGVGVAVAAAATRWLLPGLLVALPTRDAPPLRLAPTLPAWLPLALAAAAGLALLGAAQHRPVWEDKLAALSPVPGPALALDRELREQLGAAEPGQLVLIRGADPQEALERSERVLPLLDDLVAAGTIRHYQAAATLLPSARTQLARRAVLPESTALAAALEAAQQGLPFRADAFRPFLDEVADARRLEPLTPERLSGLLALRLEDLLHRQGDGWTAVIPLGGVRDPAGVAAALTGVELPGVRYLDLARASSALVADFRNQALERLAWGGAGLLLILALGLRSPLAALRAVAPIVVAAAATIASLLWLGFALSLFHLISLLLVVGIGLDYSLFFREWRYRPEAQGATLHALLVCFGSTLGVFGILALSSLPVLQAIGSTVAVGVAFSFLFGFLFALTTEQFRAQRQ